MDQGRKSKKQKKVIIPLEEFTDKEGAAATEHHELQPNSVMENTQTANFEDEDDVHEKMRSAGDDPVDTFTGGEAIPSPKDAAGLNDKFIADERRNSESSGGGGAANGGAGRKQSVNDSQVSDYWKNQYEELQKEQKNQDVDRRVLEVKNQRLEEKCTKLEAQLQTTLDLASQ